MTRKNATENEPPLLGELIGREILSVSELNALVGNAVRSAGAVWVEGEITDFTAHRSGHWYFSLRDEKSEIRAVCWRPAVFNAGFLPENGMRVLCRADVDFYEARGAVNINVRTIEPKGAGARALALRQLIERLQKEGLFAPERKKPLPFLCRRIGVVTSADGAALADIVKVAQNRFPNIRITVSPSAVQGADAPAEIARALRRLCGREIDAVIVARGGGSNEDLSAFNAEVVVRAVAAMPFPVVSAVGHETDMTACDLAADARAATPSAAAEMVVPVKSEIVSALDGLRERLRLSVLRAVSFSDAEVRALSDGVFRLAKSRASAAGYEVSALSERLAALNPDAVLGRGYSVVLKNGVPVADSALLKKGDLLKVRFAKGEAEVQVKKT